MKQSELKTYKNYECLNCAWQSSNKPEKMKCPDCGSIVYSHKQNEPLDRTHTLPVDVKTAIEILSEVHGVLPEYLKLHIGHSIVDRSIMAMEAYHAQLNPGPTEDKGIEGVKEAAYKSSGGLIDNEKYEHIEGFISGANWQSKQGKEAETIRELREALNIMICGYYDGLPTESLESCEKILKANL